MPIGYPTPEEPTRLVSQLDRLSRCLVALGIDERLAVRVAIQAARDSIPLARRTALEHVAGSSMATVSSTLRAIGRGNRWSAKWELTALEAIGIVDVEARTKTKTRTRRASTALPGATRGCTTP